MAPSRPYPELVTRSVVSKICQDVGWNTAQSTTLDTLTDVLTNYLRRVSKIAVDYANHCGRAQPSLDDLAITFRACNIDLNQLQDFVLNVDSSPLPYEVPFFPLPCRQNRVLDNCDSDGERPEYYHEWMPSLDTSKKKPETLQSSAKQADAEKDDRQNGQHLPNGQHPATTATTSNGTAPTGDAEVQPKAPTAAEGGGEGQKNKLVLRFSLSSKSMDDSADADNQANGAEESSEADLSASARIASALKRSQAFQTFISSNLYTMKPGDPELKNGLKTADSQRLPNTHESRENSPEPEQQNIYHNGASNDILNHSILGDKKPKRPKKKKNKVTDFSNSAFDFFDEGGGLLTPSINVKDIGAKKERKSNSGEKKAKKKFMPFSIKMPGMADENAAMFDFSDLNPFDANAEMMHKKRQYKKKEKPPKGERRGRKPKKVSASSEFDLEDGELSHSPTSLAKLGLDGFSENDATKMLVLMSESNDNQNSGDQSDRKRKFAELDSNEDDSLSFDLNNEASSSKKKSGARPQKRVKKVGNYGKKVVKSAEIIESSDDSSDDDDANVDSNPVSLLPPPPEPKIEDILSHSILGDKKQKKKKNKATDFSNSAFDFFDEGGGLSTPSIKVKDISAKKERKSNSGEKKAKKKFMPFSIKMPGMADDNAAMFDFSDLNPFDANAETMHKKHQHKKKEKPPKGERRGRKPKKVSAGSEFDLEDGELPHSPTSSLRSRSISPTKLAKLGKLGLDGFNENEAAKMLVLMSESNDNQNSGDQSDRKQKFAELDSNEDDSMSFDLNSETKSSKKKSDVRSQKRVKKVDNYGKKVAKSAEVIESSDDSSDDDANVDSNPVSLLPPPPPPRPEPKIEVKKESKSKKAKDTAALVVKTPSEGEKHSKKEKSFYKDESKSSKKSVAAESKSCIVIRETIAVEDSDEKVWICPTCGGPDDGSPMIGCDACEDWYHYGCVGIIIEPNPDDQWYCPKCVANTSGILAHVPKFQKHEKSQKKKEKKHKVDNSVTITPIGHGIDALPSFSSEISLLPLSAPPKPQPPAKPAVTITTTSSGYKPTGRPRGRPRKNSNQTKAQVTITPLPPAALPAVPPSFSNLMHMQMQTDFMMLNQAGTSSSNPYSMFPYNEKKEEKPKKPRKSLCSKCSQDKTTSEMIRCENCGQWCHWACVGIQSAPSPDSSWLCDKCKIKSSSRSSAYWHAERTKDREMSLTDAKFLAATGGHRRQHSPPVDLDATPSAQQLNRCGICFMMSTDQDVSDWIACDDCDQWYHFACEGISQSPSDDESWFCRKCIAKQKSIAAKFAKIKRI